MTFLKSTLFLCLLLLTFSEGISQSYQPVHGGSLYNLQDNAGSIYHLEVTDVVLDGMDTLFYFNPICREVIWNHQDSCSGFFPYPTSLCGKENLWGAYMRKEPGEEYYFTTQDGQVFYLPVNNLSSTFTFYSGGSSPITGSYTNTLFNVSPAYPNDSVRVFTLSNGKEIHVSDSHGMFTSFDFMGLDSIGTNTNSYSRAELSLPAADYEHKSIKDFYGFQPGDMRVMHSETQYGGLIYYLDIWTEDSIIAVATIPGSGGPDSDTLAVTLQRRQLIDQNPHPNDNTDTTFWNPKTVQTLKYYGDSSLNWEFDNHSHWLMVDAGADPSWGNNYSQQYTNWTQDPCGGLSGLIGITTQATYTYPYGLTYQYTESFSFITERLACFTRGGQTWGTCPNWQTILNREAPTFSSLKIFPNPGQDRVVIRTGEAVPFEVEVLDLQGKAVAPSQSGQQEIDLQLGHLPAGIYMLKVEARGQNSFHKWVKTE